ncbi:WD40 repeat protein [Eremomyces bilateralis CBS 781.70]|uniref:WD40 repeat protein n=1 Tax=Eremomyces bilateralis CBS 781.70 TaxID=1392243 RepID=A0A6G1FWC1_9PEZI|nr:WD40 repeat protein [Eremomyces bilateralis CBS 781.70]KAF1810028.1 WD40 repeat protein [Eremomyces bilateralis CBS 781.70]
MSKQYLTTHTIDNAHPTDIFALATTAGHILSASGSSSIQVHAVTANANAGEFPLVQTLNGVHKLGCHHLCTSANGRRAASAGFGGEVIVWELQEDGQWTKLRAVSGKAKAGEIWAIALSEDGKFLASSSYNGSINVWSVDEEADKEREYETKGSFGMSVDLSSDGKWTASGHENGGVYIFNNESSRMAHSLQGLIKPVRAVAFSPGGKLLAAAGDSKIIGLYDVVSGEQVAILSGHSAWITSLSWNATGEYLLSGAFDGKSKVWSVPTRACVATHAESDKTIWSTRWLPKSGKSEMFAVAGAAKSISIYREASGG